MPKYPFTALCKLHKVKVQRVWSSKSWTFSTCAGEEAGVVGAGSRRILGDPRRKGFCSFFSCFANLSNDFWTIILGSNLNNLECLHQEFFNVTKNSENVVCHFYREETFRCKIMDKHLAILAKKHVETKFCKVNTTIIIFRSLIIPNLRLTPRRRHSFATDLRSGQSQRWSWSRTRWRAVTSSASQTSATPMSLALRCSLGGLAM